MEAPDIAALVSALRRIAQADADVTGVDPEYHDTVRRATYEAIAQMALVLVGETY